MLLGAGTVTSRALAEGALDAGAEFLVTPCVVPDVIAVAKERDVAVLPGAMTPTEVFTAWSAGGDIIKIFPASNVGGASYLKALKGPFPQIPLCPTGGVNLQTIGDFVKAGASAVGVGGELVSKAAIDAGDFGKITELAQTVRGGAVRCKKYVGPNFSSAIGRFGATEVAPYDCNYYLNSTVTSRSRFTLMPFTPLSICFASSIDSGLASLPSTASFVINSAKSISSSVTFEPCT